MSPKPWRRCWTFLRTLIAGRPRPASGRKRCRPGLETLEDRSTPSAVTWIGDGDHISWEDPLNWNTGTVPSANDDVGIRSAPMVNIDSAAAAHSLNSASSLDVIGSLTLYAPSAVTQGLLEVAGTLDLEGGANLDVYSNANVYGRVQIASGTQLTLHSGTFMFGAATVVGDGLLRITDNATANIETTPTVENFSLEPTGLVTGVGTLTITGALDWTGGSMSGWSGVTQIAAGATATLHGPDAKALDTWTFNDAGTATWSGGDITGGAMTGGVLDVQAGGDFAAEGTLSCWANSMGGTVNVEGTFRTLGAGTTVTTAATVNNTGMVDAAADGQIAFNGPINNTGTIGGAGTEVVNNNLNNTGTVGGTGIVVLNGNTTNSGFGIVGAAGTVIVNGTLTTTGTIDGTGSVLVNGIMNWTDDGTMQGSGTTTVQGGGVMNVSYGNATITQAGRTLVNQGVINCTGGMGAMALWRLNTSARIVNNGAFNINPGANATVVIAGTAGVTFVNTGTLTQTAGATNFLRNLALENNGLLQVNVGELHLQAVTGVSTGIFQMQAAASILVEGTDADSNITLNPNLGDADSHMIRGAGWFVIGGPLGHDAYVTIAAFNVVEADNLAVETDGVLMGLGTLVVHNCRWDGGFMSGAEDGPGITEIPAGGTMTITGVDPVTLDNRELLNHGAVAWGAFGNPFGDILVSDGGTIVNDGGRFDVWNDATIRNADGRAGPFIVRNNGVFQKHPTEYFGTTTIELAFQNNGATVQVEGSINFGAGYSQSQDGSLTEFGFGTYAVSGNFAVTGGTMELQGGELIFRTTYVNGSPVPNFSNATFQGYGALTGPGILYTNCAQLTLTGNLTVSSVWLTGGTQTHLAGFTLIATSTSTNEWWSTIFLENGVLSGPWSNQRDSIIQGPGRYRGRQLENGGQIIAGTLNQPGQFVVEGDLLEDATGTLTVGLAANGYDQLVILGHAVLAGAIQVSLLNGFTPNVDSPDVFQIITFYSFDGAFDTISIDLGNGLSLNVTYSDTDVALVATY